MFQFHKVRLKAVAQVAGQVGYSAFQFHKVRLKEMKLAREKAVEKCFNSIRYD